MNLLDPLLGSPVESKNFNANCDKAVNGVDALKKCHVLYVTLCPARHMRSAGNMLQTSANHWSSSSASAGWLVGWKISWHLLQKWAQDSIASAWLN